MKKVLSILLSALLMLSVMPLTAFAAEIDSDSVGASYDLWLGETQVTDANKNDILRDGGKAKFDPATNTLTLNEPTIPGVCERTFRFPDSSWTESSKICSLDMVLTVKGSYHMTEAEAQHGIYNTVDQASVNKSGMLLDGDFTFCGTRIGIYSNYHLTLNGNITGEGKWCGIYVLNGECNINGGNTKAFGTDSGSYGIRSTGSVNISGSTQSVIAQAASHSGIMTHGELNINNADDQNVQIVEPVGADIKTCAEDTYYKCVYEADGKTAAERVVVMQVTEYDLWLGSTQVTSVNLDDILHDGKASFDPDTNTLKLCNVRITDPYTDGDDTYAIYSALDSDLTVKGNGTIGTSTTKNGIAVARAGLILDGNFAINGSEYGISALKGVTFNSGSMVVNGKVVGIIGAINVNAQTARLEVTGSDYAVGSFMGVEIDPQVAYVLPANGTFRNGVISYENGDPAPHVILKGKPAAYDLLLGSTQVTSENMDDILSDGGKAQFDPATNTLTLNKPVIPDAYVFEDGEKEKIVWRSEDALTVTGSYHMDAEDVSCGLSVLSDLILDGNFTFKGTYCGINLGTSSVLNIISGSLLAEGTKFGVIRPNSIRIGSGVYRVEFIGGSNALYASEMDIDPALAVISPPGCYHSGSIYVHADGYTAVQDVVIQSKSIMIGEANGDGKVNVCDVTAIQRHVAEVELLTGACLFNADVNGDGEVTIDDATHLLRYLAEFDGIVLGKQPTA